MTLRIDTLYECLRGHLRCAFFSGGPCTLVECTCETTGHCGSCR